MLAMKRQTASSATDRAATLPKKQKTKLPQTVGKRPVTAYHAFLHERRAAINEELAKGNFVGSRGKGSRLITVQARGKELWKQLPEPDKQLYRERQSAALAKYKAEARPAEAEAPKPPKKPASVWKAQPVTEPLYQSPSCYNSWKVVSNLD